MDGWTDGQIAVFLCTRFTQHSGWWCSEHGLEYKQPEPVHNMALPSSPQTPHTCRHTILASKDWHFNDRFIRIHVLLLIYSSSVGIIVTVSRDVWKAAAWSCMLMSSRSLQRARCSWPRPRRARLCWINCAWLCEGPWRKRNGRTAESVWCGGKWVGGGAEHHKLSPGFSQTADVGTTVRDEEVLFHKTTSNWHFQQGPRRKG